MNAKALGGALLLLGAAASARAYDPMRGLARELADASHSAGIRRVAVVRLDPARGAERGESALLTERLTTALVRSGRVQAVERRLLPKIMEERSLEKTGAVEASLGQSERLARVDGLVMGTYQSSGKVVKLMARVVDARSGVIVGAGEIELEREDDAIVTDMDPFDVPVPTLRGRFDFESDSTRDAVAEPADRCTGAESRVNALEESILDVKARYWAGRLKEGLPAGELKVNPGSTIPDPSIKARFYETLRRWYHSGAIVPLTPAEVTRFVRVDGEAFALHRECGL